jgi:AraC family transcriptional regulator, regulatory protein of adaptative response / DNA-3-methyladenine glycosylase II
VSATAYERNVGTGRDLAWIQVTSDAGKPELHLHAVGLRPEAIQPLVRRVRRMFDLDADLHAAHEVLRQDTRLAASIARRPGLRIAGAWDGFEWAVAVLLRADPQAAAASAATLMRLLIERYGETTADAEPGMDKLFPSADALAVADLEVTIGAPRSTAHALRRLALAVRDCLLDFSSGQPLDDFVERFVECTGMSPLQAHHVAWRALGDCDAWPVESGSPGPCAAAWRPWRSYAAMHLARATRTRGPGGTQASRAPAAIEALP